MSPRLLLAAVLLLLPAAQAQEPGGGPPPEQVAAHVAHSQGLAAALAREGGARELALAALLRQADAQQADPEATSEAPDAQAQAWLRAAAAKAGADAIANQLLIAAAAKADPIRLEAARRWQAAEPDNLAPLLHAGLTIDALLAQARGATRADTGMYPAVRWIAEAWRRHPPGAAEQAAMAGGEAFDLDEAAAMSAMAVWAAAAMPDYAALVEGCSAQMLRAQPARRDGCLHVARLLADGATSIADEHAGLAMLRALAGAAAERDEVDARQRAMDWRMLQWGRLAQQQPRGGAGQFARLLRDPRIRSEQQLVERVLAEGGVAADPPPGWQAPRR